MQLRKQHFLNTEDAYNSSRCDLSSLTQPNVAGSFWGFVASPCPETPSHYKEKALSIQSLCHLVHYFFKNCGEGNSRNKQCNLCLTIFQRIRVLYFRFSVNIWIKLKWFYRVSYVLFLPLVKNSIFFRKYYDCHWRLSHYKFLLNLVSFTFFLLHFACHWS